MPRCKRCLSQVGGGPGGLARHQQGLACRVKAAKLAKRSPRRSPGSSAGLPGDHFTNVAEHDYVPAVEPSESTPLSGDPLPGYEADDQDEPRFGLISQKRLDDGAGAYATAVARFGELERQQRLGDDRCVVGDDGLELLDEDMVDCGRDAPAFDSSSDEESDEDTPQAQEERLLQALMSLVVPPDGHGSGLKKEQRKRAYDLANACLTLSAEGSGSPPLTIASLIQKYMATGSKSSDTDRLFECYMDSLTQNDGWQTQNFSVGTGHRATARWNSDIIRSLTDVVCEYWDYMMLRPTYDGMNFGHPVSGVHMFEFENIVRRQQQLLRNWDADRDFVLLLVLFSDGTQLVQKSSISAHPMTLSVGNLPQKQSASSQVLLGYLGEFEKSNFQGVVMISPAGAAPPPDGLESAPPRKNMYERVRMLAVASMMSEERCRIPLVRHLPNRVHGSARAGPRPQTRH